MSRNVPGVQGISREPSRQRVQKRSREKEGERAERKRDRAPPDRMGKNAAKHPVYNLREPRKTRRRLG